MVDNKEQIQDGDVEHGAPSNEDEKKEMTELEKKTLEFFEEARAKQKKMRDNYRIDEKLGEGAFGEVRRCIWKEDMKDKRSSIKDYRAVKILSKAYMEEKEINSFRNEVSCMKQCDHPNIMKMYHYYEDPKRYLLITDICKGGDLFECVSEKRLNYKEGAICIKQILSAIQCMHEKHIIHRDLKPENVLLEVKGDVNQIKLIDFGTAKMFKAGSQLTEKTGTFHYMAPEVFKGDYNERCDIWSIGVIAYVIMVGKFHIDEFEDSKVKKVIKDWDQKSMDKSFGDEEFKKIEPNAQEFIKKCLKLEGGRPTAKELMETDPFIKSVTGNLKNEFNFDNKDIKGKKNAAKIEVMTDYAEKALECFRRFKYNEKVVPILAIIGCKLLKPEEKEAIQKVFRIMDESGDGNLGYEEIKNRLQNIKGKEIINDDQAKEIVKQVTEGSKILSSKNNDDQNLDQGIGLKDFLIACINYEDEQSLIGYLRNAYIAFFENEFESIDTQEMIDQFCSEKDIDNAFVKKIMHAIDEDHSNTITAAEFIGSVVGQINDSYGQSNEKKFSVGKIIQELKWPSQVGEGEIQPLPLEIDQSGTFFEYSFDEANKTVTKKPESNN